MDPSKSKFNPDYNIKNGINTALTNDGATITSSKQAPGYIFEYTYETAIGVNQRGNPVNTIRVVIDEIGNVITEYPIK